MVFDLDGVIRHFDPEHRQGVVRRHGLNDDQLLGAAFGDPLGRQVVTGRISRQEWVSAVGQQVGAPDAVAEWLGHRGHVDPHMVSLIAEVRAAGTTVALLTNGTDTIPQELGDSGLTGCFDTVFNSAVLGVAKPDPDVYQRVAVALAVEPEQVWFTDDTAANVDAALASGWAAELFVSAEAARRSLNDTGLSL